MHSVLFALGEVLALKEILRVNFLIGAATLDAGTLSSIYNLPDEPEHLFSEEASRTRRVAHESIQYVTGAGWSSSPVRHNLAFGPGTLHPVKDARFFIPFPDNLVGGAEAARQLFEACHYLTAGCEHLNYAVPPVSRLLIFLGVVSGLLSVSVFDLCKRLVQLYFGGE
ncbi:hypothetical protein CYMTET_54767 [Cymbomonas tetramitiformis]|uniref:Uncharacterized protein n=1 Tax=Cymbomonas tetramitiformis TaxID=36881 RepID=A0AAE0BFH6_9CHLO|nr:hypothetical protein CYMTET_54767 [Cymbomonas tetramitiformis]